MYCGLVFGALRMRIHQLRLSWIVLSHFLYHLLLFQHLTLFKFFLVGKELRLGTDSLAFFTIYIRLELALFILYFSLLLQSLRLNFANTLLLLCSKSV